jgi:hypothetical protein
MITTIAVTASLVLLSNVCLCWYFSREIQHLEQQQHRNTNALDQSLRELRTSVDDLYDELVQFAHNMQKEQSSQEGTDESDWWRNA